MTKVTYDVSGDIPEQANAPVGWYRAKLIDAQEGKSNAGNDMITLKFQLTHDAAGKKIAEDAYWPMRFYLMVADDRPYAKRGIRDFVTAIGAKTKGTLDLDKLNKQRPELLLKLKADTDQEGSYQPRIEKMVPIGAGEDGTPAAAVEPEEPEAEPEPEGDGVVNLDELDRAALKDFIANEQLEITVYKGWTDDQIREAIAEQMNSREEPEPDEPEEPAADEPEEPSAAAPAAEDDGYDSMDREALQAELKERKLPTGGAKSVLVKRLRQDDATSPF